MAQEKEPGPKYILLMWDGTNSSLLQLLQNISFDKKLL